MIMPIEIDDVTMAFPANALEFMPAMEEIPEEFKDDRNEWCHFVNIWFVAGLSKKFSFQPAEGVDAGMAFRQLTAIMHSYAPKHEHKEAAVAYLSSLWMESMIYSSQTEPETLIVLGEASLEEWQTYFDSTDGSYR